MGEGTKLHGCGMLDGLSCLVHTIVGTSPVEDPHVEQTEQNRIVIWTNQPNEAIPPLDHVWPKLIVEEQVWVHVPPPLILDYDWIIGLVLFNHSMVGVLGDLYPFC